MKKMKKLKNEGMKKGAWGVADVGTSAMIVQSNRQ